jgi:hypothetical protein
LYMPNAAAPSGTAERHKATGKARKRRVSTIFVGAAGVSSSTRIIVRASPDR